MGRVDQEQAVFEQLTLTLKRLGGVSLTHPSSPSVFSKNVSSRDRSSHQRCSVKKVFLEISQNSQENTCARVYFLIKLQACFCRERLKLWFFVTFNIIISHFFPENFIEIPQVVQRVRRFSPSILTILVDFSDFVKFPCYKETKDVSI